MANEERGGATTVLVAFLLGALTGAAVALLFAPATGKETRDFLSEKAREGRDRAAEAAQKTREVIKEQRDTITSALERGREAYREARGKENA
jgi:gas vesicle protein